MVRSNDLVTLNLGVTVTDLATGGQIEDLILEVQLTPINGASLNFESASVTGLPSPCIGNGPPESVITTDPVSGVVTLACNMGQMGNEIALLPLSVFADGSSPNGSSFTWAAQAYSAADEALPSNVLDGDNPVNITSAPRFDITKNYDDSNPHNRAVPFAAFVQSTNPVTGEVELGKTISYDISVILPRTPVDSAQPGGPFMDERGVEALGTFTFDEVIDPRYEAFGAKVVKCTNDPYPSSARLPKNGGGNLPYQNNRTANNGTWSCPPGSNTITVTGADTSATHIPTQGSNGATLGADILVTGRVEVWYPASGLFRYAGPDRDIATTADNGTLDGTTSAIGSSPADWGNLWQYGDDPLTGTYPTTNCLGGFDPASGTGASNFGAGYEPGWDGTTASGNNCRDLSFTIAQGSWAKSFGGNTDLSAVSAYYTGSSSLNYVVPGQSAPNSGDGPIVANQKFFSQNARYNLGGIAPLRKVGMCDAIDNATYHVTPILNGPYAGSYTALALVDSAPASYVQSNTGQKNAFENGWMVEYARFTGARKTWQNTYDLTGPPSGANNILSINSNAQDMAAQDCGEALTRAGVLEWSSDPVGDGWSEDDIVMYRVGGDPTFDTSTFQDTSLNPGDVDANDQLYFNTFLQARSSFYAPDQPAIDGVPIPSGTLFANHANLMKGWDPALGIDSPDLSYSPGGYDPNRHAGIRGVRTVGYGDRLIYRGASIDIEKTADAPGSPPGTDDLQEVFAGDPIMWSLSPKVSAINDEAIARNVLRHRRLA